MGAGPSTNLYSIGGSPINFFKFIFFEKFNFLKNVWIRWHSHKMNGKNIFVVTHNPIIIQIN